MQIKNKKIEYVDGSKLRVAVVVARFNHEITEKLLENALETLDKCKVNKKNIRIVSVAGAVEVPYALHKLAKSKKFNALISIACIIRGETPHFDYVCKMAQEGALKVMLEDYIPVGFGVLTMNNLKQAQARYHVGGESALAALELALMK
jgi:6,7-dimethyl-8-ribityllumazine synthase